MIWDLHVVFLDLTNAFGSMPHDLLWSSFSFFHIPDTITALVKSYLQDLQFCFTTSEFTTSWQCLEVGIMAGCSITPQAFMKTVEIITQASKRDAGGRRVDSGLHLPPLRAYMDGFYDCDHQRSMHQENTRKTGENHLGLYEDKTIQVQPSISTVKGVLSDLKFFIGDDPIPTVSE